jgi:hypothetical protein
MKTFYKDQTAYLDVSVIDEAGDFVSGLTIDYDIRNCSDDSIVTSGTMNEINNRYTMSYIFTLLGEYRIEYNPPSGYEHSFENIMIDILQGGELIS